MKFINEFQKKKLIIGMVHVGALPGTPNNKYSISQIISKAVQEAILYEQNGLDAIILENMHDVPYLNKEVGPEITASMAAIATEVKKNISIPSGVQILAGANKEALAVAKASGCEFIRVEGFVYSHIADEGLMNACAGKLMRYKKMIGAEDIAVFADIKKKHSSHSITSDLDITDFAEACKFFLANGIIITGRSTSEEADINELQKVHKTCDLPILIGSGITLNNIDKYWNHTDGFIIGSYFKEDGNWKNAVSGDRVQLFMQHVNNLK
ncbi:MAG: BtpA/SgcQ family protein [Candidatus Cloacimonadota bacterium]|nr:BtpA/SgcQ family protein [Candidatus Cloacimonadota bacterium]